MLIRISRLDLAILGPSLSASPVTEKSFRDACAAVPTVELPADFSTLEAGEAAATLLKNIAERLQAPGQA